MEVIDRPGNEFRVLVATDGSVHAQRAVAAALRFPWPPHTRILATAVRLSGPVAGRSILAALGREAEIGANHARRALSARWPDAGSSIVDNAPIDGILDEARRFGADVIVIGRRGHGLLRRLVMGSTSRGIARLAPCAVLVVPRRTMRFRRILMAVDGSANAQRALKLVTRFTAPEGGGEIILFRSVEPLPVPSQGIVPAAVRASVRRDIARVNRRRVRDARRDLQAAERTLGRAWWRTRIVVTAGVPLSDLLATVRRTRPDLVVVGARGVSGVEHLLLGSVAEGVLNQCPCPVLVVR